MWYNAPPLCSMHTIVRAVHQQLHVHYSARQRSHGEFKQRLFVRVDTMHVQFIRIRIRIFLCARSLSSSTTNSICGIFLLLGVQVPQMQPLAAWDVAYNTFFNL